MYLLFLQNMFWLYSLPFWKEQWVCSRSWYTSYTSFSLLSFLSIFAWKYFPQYCKISSQFTFFNDLVNVWISSKEDLKTSCATMIFVRLMLMAVCFGKVIGQQQATPSELMLTDFVLEFHSKSVLIHSNSKDLLTNYFKHEYLRSRAYICLSLSSPFSSPPVTVIQIWPLSRYSCFYLGSLHPRNFLFKAMVA